MFLDLRGGLGSENKPPLAQHHLYQPAVLQGYVVIKPLQQSLSVFSPLFLGGLDMDHHSPQ